MKRNKDYFFLLHFVMISLPSWFFVFILYKYFSFSVVVDVVEQII